MQYLTVVYEMSSKAIVIDTGISVKKINPIADLVRGMKVSEALITLRFLPSPAVLSIAPMLSGIFSDNRIDLSRLRSLET